MKKHEFKANAVEFHTETFHAVAPLGDETNLQQLSVDCETCCPGSCTGCTQCNKCNMIF